MTERKAVSITLWYDSWYPPEFDGYGYLESYDASLWESEAHLLAHWKNNEEQAAAAAAEAKRKFLHGCSHAYLKAKAEAMRDVDPLLGRAIITGIYQGDEPMPPEVLALTEKNKQQ